MRAAALILTGLCLAAPAPAAQEEARADSVPADTTKVLRTRGREYLRLGDQPVLKGVEEGENEFRSSTPVLAEAEIAETRVSMDENYARRRAMYSGGSTFSRPLDSRRVVLPEVSARPRIASAPGPSRDSSSSWFGWVALALAGPILVVIMLRRWRPRPIPAHVATSFAGTRPAARRPARATRPARPVESPVIEFLGGEAIDPD